MKLLENKELGNGLDVTIQDHSRQIAGDRYNVKIICLVTVNVNTNWFADLSDHDDVIEQIKSRMGDQLEFQMVKERSFVDEKQKDELIADMVGQINNIIESYVSTAPFPYKLFCCRLDDLRQKMSVPAADIITDIDEDDEEPADFSSCFADP